MSNHCFTFECMQEINAFIHAYTMIWLIFIYGTRMRTLTYKQFLSDLCKYCVHYFEK